MGERRLSDASWFRGVHSRPGGRGFGADWFAEWFYHDAFVSYFEHGQDFGAAWRLQHDFITLGCLHERAAEGGSVTDMVAVEIDFVGADDAGHTLGPGGIRIVHGGSEECFTRTLSGSRSLRIDDFGGFDAPGQEADSPIDLPQSPLAVLVVGIFTAIAIACRPCDDFDDGRAIFREQEMTLGFQALKAAGRDVVGALRGGGLEGFRSSGEAFLHGVVLSWRKLSELHL